MTFTEIRLPLSSQQQFCCESELSETFHPHWIISRALRVTGSIDLAVLQLALNDLVVRHEVLRTTIECDAEPPYQRVHPPLPVPLTVHDLTATPYQARQAFAEQRLTEAERSSMDVRRLPLLQAELARFDSQDSVLSLVVHHTACDAWSMNLLVRDLAACYAARIEHRLPVLPQAPQYGDYAQWERVGTAGPALLADLQHWQAQLEGARVFTLPTDRPVPVGSGQSYRQQSFEIDADVAAAVTRFARQEHCSVFMILLAAFNLLAHRTTGTVSPCVSTMFHGRSEPRFWNTVGLFLNFLLMRADLSGCRSFRDVVLRTRITSVQAYEHQLPYQQALAMQPSVLEPLADPSQAYLVFGLWDSTLTRQAAEPFELADGAYYVRKPDHVSEHVPGSPVVWSMHLTPSGQLGGGLQFNSESFDKSTVAGWLADYHQILANGLADPDLPWPAL